MYLIDPGGLKEVALIFPENSGGQKNLKQPTKLAKKTLKLSTKNLKLPTKNPQPTDKKPQTTNTKLAKKKRIWQFKTEGRGNKSFLVLL